jgi:hypothetical protein
MLFFPIQLCLDLDHAVTAGPTLAFTLAMQTI